MNSITNNYARILCRLQYIFYRASFLIVIRIHRGINTTNRSYWSKQQTLAATGATGTTATKPPPKRQPPESIERTTTATGADRQPWSLCNTATGVDRTSAIVVDRTTATGATGTTASRAKATGAACERYWLCEQQILEPISDSQVDTTTGASATGDPGATGETSTT